MWRLESEEDHDDPQARPVRPVSEAEGTDQSQGTPSRPFGRQAALRAAETVTVQATVEQSAWFRVHAAGPGPMADQAEQVRAALDMRLSGRPMTGPGKISAAAHRIAAIWHDRPDALQLVFCDSAGIAGLWTPLNPENPGFGWDAHQQLHRELSALGVPQAAIRIEQGLHETAYLAEIIRDSPVRVLITNTWGALPGPVPALAAVHHLDPPETPEGLDRRERAIPAGDTEIVRYVTGDTPDSAEWQALDRNRQRSTRTEAGASLADQAGREKAARQLALDDPEIASIDALLGSGAAPQETVRLSARAIATRTRAVLPEAAAVVLGWNDLGQLAPAGFLDRRGSFIGWGFDGFTWDNDWESDGYRSELKDAIRPYCANLTRENQGEWSRLTTPPPSARFTGIREYCIPVERTLAETSSTDSPQPGTSPATAADGDATARSVTRTDFPSGPGAEWPRPVQDGLAVAVTSDGAASPRRTPVMSDPPSPHETVRAYLHRTRHEFVAYQGRPVSGPMGCACGLSSSNAIHVGDELLGTRDYLNRVTAALNALVMNTDSGLDDPLDMPAAAGVATADRTPGASSGPPLPRRGSSRSARPGGPRPGLTELEFPPPPQPDTRGWPAPPTQATGQPGPASRTSSSPVPGPRPRLR